jgi:hypothetical protein
MNSVAQVNNMADFVRLVSAARTRNSGLVNGTVRSASQQAPRPMSFQNVARSSGMAGYSNTRHVIRTAPAEASAATNSVDYGEAPQRQTRVLGTKFDAYA